VYGPFLPVARPARYDDYVADCVAYTLASIFVSTNAHLANGLWIAPPVAAELDGIYRAVLSGRTYDGHLFSEALTYNQRTLFVAVVEIVDDEVVCVDVEGGTGFGRELMNIACHKVKVILAAPACADHPILHSPIMRWKISRRKFGLLKRKNQISAGYVRGPYLAVIAYEPGSRVIARMRLWPVWYSAELGRMQVVRSNLERVGAAAFAQAGAVVFTLVAKKQLCVLQQGLGHRWRGDLTSYRYQPDYLPMPLENRLAIVAELFGVRSVKRYDASKAAKKEAGQNNPDVRFVFLEGRRIAVEDVICWVKALMADPANGIWRLGCASDKAA
jgi:hypothetical protein